MEFSNEEWELWTWREVARALKVSRSWIYAKVESGDAAGSAGTHIPGPYQITKQKLTAVAPDNAVAKSMAQAGTQRT